VLLTIRRHFKSERRPPVSVTFRDAFLDKPRHHFQRPFIERHPSADTHGVDVEDLRSLEYPSDWRPANPSSLLSILLLFGDKLGFNSIWNLRALDRKSFGFFIPANYLDFGMKVIEQGMNYTNRIGFDVWSVSQFNKEFERGMKTSFPSNALSMPKECAALCTVASLLFPDRLPLHLERLL